MQYKGKFYKKLRCAIFASGAAFFAFPGIQAEEAPVWRSAGDNISVNISYDTIGRQMKREKSPDIKIMDASLSRQLENTVNMDITAMILKPQFKGTVCNIKANLYIYSISPEGSSVKVNGANVSSCKTGKGSGMDSLVKAAAGIALRDMLPDMEKDIVKSIDDVIVPTADMLNHKTKKKVEMKFSVHDGGLSFFLHTGKIADDSFLAAIPYILDDPSSCMSQAVIQLYRFPSVDPQTDSLRIFVRNIEKKDSLDIHLSSSAKKIHAETVSGESELYWNGMQKDFSGKDFSVSVLQNPQKKGNENDISCGTIHFTVPEKGSVALEIIR